MPVPDRLLPPRVSRDASDGEIDFDQAFGVGNVGLSFGCTHRGTGLFDETIDRDNGIVGQVERYVRFELVDPCRTLCNAAQRDGLPGDVEGRGEPFEFRDSHRAKSRSDKFRLFSISLSRLWVAVKDGLAFSPGRMLGPYGMRGFTVRRESAIWEVNSSLKSKEYGPCL
jgi:hypothetical protein